MSQNLRIELKGTRIRVTEIYPGRVATNFFNIAVNVPKKSAQAFEGYEALEAEDIADAIIYAVDTPCELILELLNFHPQSKPLVA
jgi:NADP-dependent 3-hydroxy acid dehydrogenase YdfG